MLSRLFNEIPEHPVPPQTDSRPKQSTPSIADTLGVRRGTTPLWRRWPVLLLALASAGAAAWWFMRPPAPTDYVFEPADPADIRATVTATGTLQPIDKVTIGAEVSGRVEAILVDFNDRVSKGQVLARLNTDELEARAVQTRAGVAQAQANLAKAEHDFTRASDLSKRGYVSQEAFDQTLTSRDLARAALNSARAVSDQSEANLAKAAIRSPMDGIVLDRKVERGQTVASSFQTPELFVIASDLTHLELTVDIDEADIGELRVGQAASFAVDAYPARNFSAQLLELRNAARTVANVVTYQGVLDVNNSDGLLKPGMTATADIVVHAAQHVLSVPNRALRFTPNAKAGPSLGAQNGKPDDGPPLAPGTGRVWTVGHDGAPLARVVRLGITDGKRTQILSGNLRPGEQLIVDAGEPGSARPRSVRIRM